MPSQDSRPQGKRSVAAVTKIDYEGESYSRDNLEHMLTEYQGRHTLDLKKFEDLSQAYEHLAKEMTQDISDQKSAFEYVSNIAVLDRLGTNLKGLIHKIPFLRGWAPSRDLKELLGEKIEIAQRRVQEIGNYIDTLQDDVKNLQDDITRLNKRMIQAAQNRDRAAAHVLRLEDARKAAEAQLASIADPKSVEARELQAKTSELKRMIWDHGARLRTYSQAEERIATIINMSNNFLEMMTNLHGNMSNLCETGNEVLNELHGNLAGLSSISKAGELSVAMHRSMQSLRVSANRLAVLASETSRYLTQNVDRLTAEMKIYDKETEHLVASNLAAEREMKEQRINETIELARMEYEVGTPRD
ncbi:MAG: hypothetical protein HY078_07130 [Elusimicrobia bacterium]|nr:hypothetical protein [Elusimicrobiota bacterium]